MKKIGLDENEHINFVKTSYEGGMGCETSYVELSVPADNFVKPNFKFQIFQLFTYSFLQTSN